MDHQQSFITRLEDWLVAKAIGAEIRKAGLQRDTVQLPFGQVSYLRSPGLPASRTAIVLLHGAASDHTAWVRFAAELKAELPLLVPDLPGHGGSASDPAMSYSIAAQAERLAQLFAALNLDRVHLVASSMSGAIAIRLAADHPALVASMVLAGAMGVRAKPSWLERQIAETGRNPMVAIRDKADYLAMLRIGMRKPPFMPGFVVSSLTRAYVARSALNQKIARDIEADLDQGDNVRKVACPVLLVWGHCDRVSDISNAEKLHRELKSSSLTILDGIGHVPMVEAPREFANACRSFLAQAAKAGAEVTGDARLSVS